MVSTADMAKPRGTPSRSMDELIQKENLRNIFNSLGTKLILAGKFRDVLGYFAYNKPVQAWVWSNSKIRGLG
jgi:hypothetical protein